MKSCIEFRNRIKDKEEIFMAKQVKSKGHKARIELEEQIEDGLAIKAENPKKILSKLDLLIEKSDAYLKNWDKEKAKIGE